MNAKQLKFFRDIDEKEVQNLIIGELRDYRALKVQIENKKEQEAAGVINLFPSVRQQDRLNELKVKQIERALANSLDFIERRIIEMKYFTSQETKDINIYLELGLKKGKYYEKKRAAIYRLATALGIIWVLLFFRTKIEQKPDKFRTKWVPFWASFYFSIGGKIFLSASYLADRRRIFPLSVVYSGVSNDWEGCRQKLRGEQLESSCIACDSHGEAKCEIPLQTTDCRRRQRPLLQSRPASRVIVYERDIKKRKSK